MLLRGFYVTAVERAFLGHEGLVISHIGFGTSGVPPTIEDTALTDGVTKALDGLVPIGDPLRSGLEYRSLRFRWTISAADSAFYGVPFREWGLLTADGVLCTRSVWPGPVTLYPGMELGEHIDIHL